MREAPPDESALLPTFLDELWNGKDEIRRPPVAIFSSPSLLEIARFRLLAYSGQMIHRRHNAFLIALGLLLGFCDGATAQAATPAELISSFRLQHGEGKVRIDPTLNRIAHAQAAAMAAKDVLDHGVLGPFSSRVAPFGSKRAAENIAFGYDSFPKTLDQWIGSSGHRSNLLMHGATRVGVGSAKSSKTVRTYWAMVIAEERPKQAKQEATKLTNKLDESCQVKLVNLCLY
jgi:hypothetical protein